MPRILLFNAISVLWKSISFIVLYINEARCAREIKSGRPKAQRVFDKKRILFTGKWDLNLHWKYTTSVNKLWRRRSDMSFDIN